MSASLPSAGQHPSYGDCLEVRGNIIRTAPCWVVWQCLSSQKHTHVSSSYRSNRLGLSHWDPCAMHKNGCLELYYCNMVEWSWWDSSLIWKTNWLPSVLWHCWFGCMTCKNRPWYDLYYLLLFIIKIINTKYKYNVWWDVKPCSINQSNLQSIRWKNWYRDGRIVIFCRIPDSVNRRLISGRFRIRIRILM